MKNFLLPTTLFAVAIYVWQYVSDSGWISPIILPSPLSVFQYLFESIRTGTMLEAFLITMKRLCLGYAMGLSLGFAIGLLLYINLLARNTIGLSALGLQTLPSVCWAPLAIMWFGQSESAMCFVVIMGSVWGVSLGTCNAMRSVPPIYLKAARVMGSKGAHTWFTVMLPAAQPQLLESAKLGWAFAWRSLMSAEIYVTIITSMGLGQLLHFGRELNAMDQVVAVMLVIIVTGLTVDRLVFVPCEKYLRRTRGLSHN